VNTTWETIINPHIILYSIISIVDNHIGDLVCLVSYKIATDMSRGDLMEVIAFTASPMELSILRALNLECVRGECKNDAISAQIKRPDKRRERYYRSQHSAKPHATANPGAAYSAHTRPPQAAE
jgi:hypothetical protein